MGAGFGRTVIGLAVVSAIVVGCRMPHVEAVSEPASQQDETLPSQPIEPGAGETVAAPGGPDGEKALAIADVSAVERDGRLRFVVSLSGGSGAPVTVAYATEDGTATAGSDYVTANGTLTFAGASAETREIEVQVHDDAEYEARETFTMRLSDAQGAKLSMAAATATIVDDDRRSVAVYPTELNVVEGEQGSYTVVLGSQPAAQVTVTVEVAEELSVAPQQMVFTAADWRTGRTVTVAAAADEDALADAPVELTQVASGGRYDGMQAAVTVTIVENDVTTLAAGAARAAEGDGRLSFVVSLSLANDNVVTVEYATGGPSDTARAGADYTGVSRTLSFPAGSTEARTIEVVVRDDSFDEADEEFTLRLSNPVHAALAGGGDSTTATGTIEDDDAAPVLTITGGSASESDANLTFAVALDRASGRAVTVGFATTDATALAGVDYTAVSGTLTFPAGATVQSIAVPIVNDQDSEETETFTVTLTLSDHERATLPDPTATGTITDDDVTDQDGTDQEDLPLELESLQVTGGGAMYPAFDAAIHHYAVTCSNATTLQVTATAKRNGASLTLLRANPDDNHQSVGNLDVEEVSVNEFHDIAIELNDGGETTMYIVHCHPSDFAEVGILNNLDSASEGLLFVSPRHSGVGHYGALIDYNGVPRQVLNDSYNFRPFPDGPTIDGRQVRYGAHQQVLDEEFELIRSADVAAPLTIADAHDFLITDRGFLFISYYDATRDPGTDQDNAGNPLASATQNKGSVIQEVALDGAELFRWNSWEHVPVTKDCMIPPPPANALKINSLQIVDGDIIASFSNCAQILRIDRSSGTGAVEWKLGGTPPDPDSTNTHTYLPLVGDPAGEFCGQHHATLTASGTVVMFDNGVSCHGPRKDLDPFSRVVEYDISSGTQATFLREYRQPPGQGYAGAMGGVTVLHDDTDRNNDRWLITWGYVVGATVGVRTLVAISEVDPATGTSLFELSMSKSGNPVRTYRVYHQPETAVTIPLNLP